MQCIVDSTADIHHSTAKPSVTLLGSSCTGAELPKIVDVGGLLSR